MLASLYCVLVLQRVLQLPVGVRRGVRHYQVWLDGGKTGGCLEVLVSWATPSLRRGSGRLIVLADSGCKPHIRLGGSTPRKSCGLEQVPGPLLREGVALSVHSLAGHTLSQERVWYFAMQRFVLTPHGVLTQQTYLRFHELIMRVVHCVFCSMAATAQLLCVLVCLRFVVVPRNRM